MDRLLSAEAMNIADLLDVLVTALQSDVELCLAHGLLFLPAHSLSPSRVTFTWGSSDAGTGREKNVEYPR